MKKSVVKGGHIFLVVSMMVWLAAWPAFAKSKGGKIEGFVGQSATVPAAGETVKLLDGESGKVLDIDETNFFGKYKFDDLEPGYYAIQVGKIKKEVMLKGKKKRLDIDLSVDTGAMDYSKAGKTASGAGGTGKSAPAGPNDQGLMQQMAARYYGYQGSTETKAALCPNGSYYDTSESSYSGGGYDSLGNQTMAFGAASQGQGGGSWTVQGSVQQGVITVNYSGGNVTRINYRAIDSQGCYDFNGSTMCRQGPANCQ